MATPNRSTLIARAIKVARKYYKPVSPPKDRSLFEHLVYACLLEDSPYESADQVFETLKRDYFDWNEVRVSTIRELTEVLKPLVHSTVAASRLKQTLRSIFESVYQYDIESLKKQNLSLAVKQFEKYNGTTSFVVSYVTQAGLGGHSIPVNRGTLVAMHAIGAISDNEFQKGVVPGLERAVSKSKGIEVGSLLHQLGVEVGRSPYGQTTRKLLLEIAPGCKDRLPKRQSERPAAKQPSAAKPRTTDGKARDKPTKGAGKAPAADKAAKKESKQPPTKRPTATKKTTKSGKGVAKRTVKKSTGRRLTKQKPR